MSDPTETHADTLQVAKALAGNPTTTLSASQFETYERCHRLWWFNYVIRLPQVEKGYFKFGTVLHAVIQRWLEADDQGRAQGTGQPVDLYPAGWDADITPAESGLVKQLIQKAIEVGAISRMPGRLVEAEFLMPLVEEGSDGWAGGPAQVIGYIDLVTPDGVHDHKSNKNPAKYKLSANALKKNTQLLLYAYAWLENRRDDGIPDPTDGIVVRHNTFSKDPANPAVYVTEARVSVAQVEAKWAELQETAKGMVSMKARYPDLSEWQMTPAAENRANACNSYGGCQYMMLCGGVDSPKDYVSKILTLQRNDPRITIKNPPTPDLVLVNTKASDNQPVNSDDRHEHPDETPQPQTGAPRMGLFEGKLAKRAASNGTAANGTQAPPVAPAGTVPAVNPAPAPPPTVTTARQVGAPWGRADCTACGGKGFSTSGDICRICRGNQAREGKTNPDWYETGVETDPKTGVMRAYWEAKEAHLAEIEEHANGQAGGTLTIGQGKPAVAKTQVQAPAAPAPAPAPAAPASAPAPPPVADAAGSTEAAPDDAPNTDAGTPKTRNRKKASFVLLVNCGLQTPTAGVIRLEEVFTRYGAELAADEGVASYWDMDPFARRDHLARHAATIIEKESWGTKYVMASTGTPDHRAFVEAIRPYAGDVITKTGD